MYRILTLLFVLSLAPVAVAQNPAAQENLIEFSYDQADWKDVIPWFAEQAGYSWTKRSEWPKGTFTLEDKEKYSPMGALDQLNYALRLQNPPYTIVRNRNQLILTEASKPLPVQLIDTVTPAELDQRGEYEIVRCKFSLGSISVATVEQDLRSKVSQQYQQFAKAILGTNEFYARETGGNLREVRDTIEAMIRMKGTSVSTYKLKHYDPEQFLISTRPLLGIAEGSYQNNAGTLILSIDPVTDRFILKGTPMAIEEFKAVAAEFDVPADAEEVNTERPFMKSYPVFTDPEVAFKVVQTMLDGTDATVGQDAVTGAIIVLGRKKEHERTEETITELRGETGATKIVQLQNSSASTILSAVQSLMNLGTTSMEGPQKGPKLLANTLQNYIVIRGTPAEIFEATQTIIQLDQASQPDPNRVRTNVRVLKMPPSKRDDLLDAASDYMRSTGRQNRLRIIRPEDRGKRSSRFRTPGFDNRVPQQPGTGEALLPQSTPAVRDAVPNLNDGSQTGQNTSRRSTSIPSGLLNFALTSMLTYQPQDEAGSNSDSQQTRDQGYIPPDNASSVPGSPITVKATPFGILLESDDLDALDDLESLLLSEAGQEGTDQGLTVFYLKYQKANSIKSALDKMFGLGGSDGGGGGDDLLSGIVGNMAGEGAGNLLGGMLGGGGSSSSGAVVALEGDVQIGLYSPMNLLYISGATQSDLDIIQDAIDIFDQPTPPHNPELSGQFYVIPIQHRDAEEILELVKNLLPDYFTSTEQPQQNQGGGGNAPEQVAKAMRNIAGGGKGQAGKKSEDEQPKAQLQLDKENDQILLTGPDFIYRQVKAIVEKLDTPNEEDMPKGSRVVGGVSDAILSILQEQFGGKLELMDESEAAETDDAKKKVNEGSGNQRNNAQDAATKQRNAQRQEAAELFRNIRNQAQAGQRGGGGGGQRGGGGGGGQRGGGGRGGR